MRSVRPAAAIRCFEPLDEGQIVDGREPDHHGAEIRISRQQPAHRLDEQVAAFLPSHAAERSDPILSGQACFGEGGEAVGGRGIEIDVDAVKDHRRRAPQKLRRDLARRDHRVHSPDEKIGEPGFLALGGRIEDQRKSVAEQVQEKSGEHLDVAARVPDADLAVRRRTEAQTHKVAEAQGRDSLRLVRPAPCRTPALGDQRRDGAVHRRAARIAPIQIGDDDLERVEGLVIKFPAHPASPDRIASKERASTLRSRAYTTADGSIRS